MLSPSRKRATPDSGHESSNTLHKIARIDSTEGHVHIMSAPQSEINTAPIPAASSALSESRASQPPSAAPTPTKDATKPPAKKKRTKAEIEAEKAIKEAEKAQKDLGKAQKEAEKEAERKAKLVEKEEKRRKKEEEDKAKEEERQVKEEERKKKQAERDAIKQAKESERAEKEAEKQRKLEEQKKKDSAQLKLKSFLTPRPSATPAIHSTNPDSDNSRANVPSKIIKQQAASDYAATFLPFNVPKNCNLAPTNLHITHEDVESTTVPLCEIVGDIISPLEALKFPARDSEPRSKSIPELIGIIHGTAGQPIDLTSQEYGRTMQEALFMLNKNLTYLEFHRDVRPPFCGISTKTISDRDLNRIKRRPYHARTAVLDYDYDSEAEWDEPEEGEDIGDDDDDESDDGDDDMDGFIDDDGNTTGARRPGYIRDLPPINSGLQWQDPSGILHAADHNTKPVEWTELEMCFLLVPEPIAINPFSKQYWNVTTDSSPIKSSMLSAGGVAAHRHPFKDKTSQVNGVGTAPPMVFKAKKALEMIPPQFLDDFKNKIAGQEMTKVAMREHLKKEFPSFKKDVISNTLDAVAERESKKPNAKWCLR